MYETHAELHVKEGIRYKIWFQVLEEKWFSSYVQPLNKNQDFWQK